MIQRAAKTLWSHWDHFWFGPQNLLALAVMRIIVCGSLFGMYCWRQFYVKWFFTDEGFVPHKHMLQMVFEYYRPPFTWFIWSQEAVPYAHFALIILLLLCMLGVGGRKIMWLAWFLNIGFIQRNYGAIYGADLIGGIWLFYLSFTQSNARLSIVSVIKKQKSKIIEGDLVTNMMIRLIQIQLCTIYIFTGFEKLRGYSWWDGTALWTVFGNPQMSAFNMEFVRGIPLVLAFFAFATILFEVYFPLLIWFKKTKLWAAMIGVSFHFGIAITIGLYAFGTVMIAPYLLFFKEEDLKPYLQKIQRSNHPS